MTTLKLAPYLQQKERWPSSGRHIMAQFDDSSVIVYQAYNPAIGRFAAAHNHFGGDFSYSRMSWIKPNFLWMMYRSGWGTKQNQEVTLAIRLKRSYFDAILAEAVASSFDRDIYSSREAWQKEIGRSNVRLQWDPDHNPSGEKMDRRAIQLGLRREMLDGFRGDGILEIEDISQFVATQRPNATKTRYTHLETPLEQPYPVTDPQTRKRLGL